MTPARRGRRPLRTVATALFLALAAVVAAAVVAAAAPAAAQEWAYAVERGNVYRVNLFSHASEVVATSGDPELWLHQLTLAEDGLLYGVRHGVEDVLYRVDPASGAAFALAPLPAGVEPMGMASDGAGGLWVVSFDRRLLTLDRATGVVLDERPLTVEGDFLGAAGGRPGELYVLTWTGPSLHPAVERIDPATGVGTAVFQVPTDGNPIAIPQTLSVDASGDIWVGDHTGQIVLGVDCFAFWRFDPVTGAADGTWDGCLWPGHPALASFAVLEPFGAVEIPAAGPLGLALLALALAAVALRRLAGR